MKKLVAVLFAGALVLGAFGCTKKDGTTPKDDATKTPAATKTAP